MRFYREAAKEYRLAGDFERAELASIEAENLEKANPAPRTPDQISREDFLTDAKSNMSAAYAAEATWRREPVYNNWTIAHTRFADAAEAYRKAGDTERAQFALGEKKRMEVAYHEFLEHKSKRQEPLNKADCDNYKTNLPIAERAGVPRHLIDAMRERMRKGGCF